MILSNDNLYTKNLKEKIQSKLAEKKLNRGRIIYAKPPRYDEVFFEGVKWLDSLVGNHVQEQMGRKRIE